MLVLYVLCHCAQRSIHEEEKLHLRSNEYRLIPSLSEAYPKVVPPASTPDGTTRRFGSTSLFVNQKRLVLTFFVTIVRIMRIVVASAFRTY